MKIQIEDNGLQRVFVTDGEIEVFGQDPYLARDKPAGVTMIIEDKCGCKLYVYLTMEQARNLLKIVPEPGQHIQG